MDDGDKVPTYWPAMLFVPALQRKFPISADRQRNRQKEKDVEKKTFTGRPDCRYSGRGTT